MAKKESEKTEERSKIADAAEVGMGAQFEGEKIEKKDIDGEEVILVDFAFMPNKFKPGEETAILQLEIDGALRICFIGGQVVVQGLKKIEEKGKDKFLPGAVIFTKEKTKDGKKTFWTMK